MTWIEVIDYPESAGALRKLYDRIRAPDGTIDNILKSHSLRPHTLTGHMTLYKHVLHHPGNTLPKWFLESIGVWVSILNRCDYCVEHHFAGLTRLLDRGRAQEIRAALTAGDPAIAFGGKELALVEYAGQVTTEPSTVTEATIGALRAAGANDGEVLEVNQVSAYFAYANRTVLGLGVNTAGDELGLSPGESSDPDNWSHD